MLKNKLKSSVVKNNKSNDVDKRLNFSEIFGVEHHGGWIYMFILGVIVLALVGTAIGVVGQVQHYYRDLNYLQQLHEEAHTLRMENQRMLLEQQTFSATPQIMRRAVELGMFYPNFTDRMIIEVNPQVVTHQSVASVPLASGVQP